MEPAPKKAWERWVGAGVTEVVGETGRERPASLGKKGGMWQRRREIHGRGAVRHGRKQG
jgi:hypothetical protein